MLDITKVERFNVHACPGATAVIKEINPLLLKTYTVDTTSYNQVWARGFRLKCPN
jgi:hypothetical protein